MHFVQWQLNAKAKDFFLLFFLIVFLNGESVNPDSHITKDQW